MAVQSINACIGVALFFFAQNMVHLNKLHYCNVLKLKHQYSASEQRTFSLQQDKLWSQKIGEDNSDVISTETNLYDNFCAYKQLNLKTKKHISDFL